MAPLKPHWPQPSHPEIQQVLVNEAAFTTKSISKVALPPFGFFAKMSFPPCTLADGPTYATVQMGRDKHLNLNSDLLYINHSCEPSLIFDTANLNIIAGPRGLQPGEELTFFYPSTEWAMAQPFDCLCGTPTCRGRIAGARDMPRAQLDGVWLNGHIRELLDERDGRPSSPAAAASVPADDPTAQALRDALLHAEKVVEAARAALVSYARAAGGRNGGYGHAVGPPDGAAVAAPGEPVPVVSGAARRGPTSRELSGEMGGDTVCV